MMLGGCHAKKHTHLTYSHLLGGEKGHVVKVAGSHSQYGMHLTTVSYRKLYFTRESVKTSPLTLGMIETGRKRYF